MKLDSAILHISDLHLTNFTPVNDTTRLSYLVDNLDFLNLFIDSVNEECNTQQTKLSYIFITGDIANEGSRQEYEKAISFIENLVEKLHVDKENICIVPGNHDINWTDIKRYIEDNDYKGSPNELHKVKFEKYEKFIIKAFDNKKPFIHDSPVVELKIDVENKLIILGLNTIYYESHLTNNHKGYIEHQSLRKFLDENSLDKYSDYGKVVLMHHHCNKFLENDSYSWSIVEEILNKYNFNVFIHGHNHNDISTETDDGEINKFIGVGSFAKKDNSITNSFNLFFNGKNENEFFINTYHYEHKNTSKPYWQHQSKIKGSKRSFKIFSKPIDLESNSQNLIDTLTINPEKLADEYSLQKYLLKESSKIKKNKTEIIKFIRQNKLFKTGHFHWSENFRSHGLIDIFSLLSNTKCQDLILDSIIEIIKTQNISVDNLLGVGFEGNIIGALISLNYPRCNYSYITSSEDYFNEFEKRVVLENVDITIIEDVIFQADSLKKFLFNNKNFVERINNINLITLFFCGNETDLSDISKIPKLNFSYVFNEIKIEPCPYKDVKKCPIVINKLDNFYKFY